MPLVPGWRVVRSRRALDALHALLAREAYDVVHAHSLYSPLAHAATYLAQLIGVPSLLTSHSLVDGASSLLLRALRARLGDWPTRLSAVGSLAVEQLRKLSGRADVALLPNGIDVARFAAPPRRRAITSPSSRCCGCTRASVRWRWCARCPRSCDARARTACRTTCAWSSPATGRLRAAVRAEAVRLGVADRARAASARCARAEIPALLAAADLFALPSVNEAFGIVALEARAAGLPVVAMRDGGAADLVEHGRDGLLAEDDEELAAQLGTLVVDARAAPPHAGGRAAGTRALSAGRQSPRATSRLYASLVAPAPAAVERKRAA